MPDLQYKLIHLKKVQILKAEVFPKHILLDLHCMHLAEASIKSMFSTCTILSDPLVSGHQEKHW
jgi:hypothetical protein